MVEKKEDYANDMLGNVTLSSKHRARQKLKTRES